VLNKAEILGDKIFKAIMEEQGKMDLTIINRIVGYDFVRLFKETALDYAGNCVLVERLFPKESCMMQTKKVQKLSDKGMELKGQILTLVFEVGNNPDLSDEEKMAKLNEAQAMQKELADLPYEDAETELLTYSPYGEDDENSMIVLDLGSEKVNKRQYASFCMQIGYFVFNYFSTMMMIPVEGFDVEVMTVKNTSCIDIVCKIAG
jgi:hypothetical protein